MWWLEYAEAFGVALLACTVLWMSWAWPPGGEGNAMTDKATPAERRKLSKRTHGDELERFAGLPVNGEAPAKPTKGAKDDE